MDMKTVRTNLKPDSDASLTQRWGEKLKAFRARVRKIRGVGLMAPWTAARFPNFLMGRKRKEVVWKLKRARKNAIKSAKGKKGRRLTAAECAKALDARGLN